MFNEYDMFELACPVSDGSIPLGTRGVVLMVFGGDPCAYEVEFPDGQGGNLGDAMTYTIREDAMSEDSISV
jgi:hypothetical protein